MQRESVMIGKGGSMLEISWADYLFVYTRRTSAT